MSMHGADWGMLVKFLYTNFLRKPLKKLADSTEPKFDDATLRVLDTLAGIKDKK